MRAFAVSRVGESVLKREAVRLDDEESVERRLEELIQKSSGSGCREMPEKDG